MNSKRIEDRIPVFCLVLYFDIQTGVLNGTFKLPQVKFRIRARNPCQMFARVIDFTANPTE